MRKTPVAMLKHPTIVINVTGSLNMSHEKNTVTIYPKLTIGYAMLRLTRESTTSQNKALIPKIARPVRTKGVHNAVRTIDGASASLDIFPTLVMPCFNNSCPATASNTLRTIRSTLFNMIFLSSNRSMHSHDLVYPKSNVYFFGSQLTFVCLHIHGD